MYLISVVCYAIGFVMILKVSQGLGYGAGHSLATNIRYSSL